MRLSGRRGAGASGREPSWSRPSEREAVIGWKKQLGAVDRGSEGCCQPDRMVLTCSGERAGRAQAQAAKTTASCWPEPRPPKSAALSVRPRGAQQQGLETYLLPKQNQVDSADVGKRASERGATQASGGWAESGPEKVVEFERAFLASGSSAGQKHLAARLAGGAADAIPRAGPPAASPPAPARQPGLGAPAEALQERRGLSLEPGHGGGPGQPAVGRPRSSNADSTGAAPRCQLAQITIGTKHIWWKSERRGSARDRTDITSLPRGATRDAGATRLRKAGRGGETRRLCDRGGARLGVRWLRGCA